MYLIFKCDYNNSRVLYPNSTEAKALSVGRLSASYSPDSRHNYLFRKGEKGACHKGPRDISICMWSINSFQIKVFFISIFIISRKYFLNITKFQGNNSIAEDCMYKFTKKNSTVWHVLNSNIILLIHLHMRRTYRNIRVSQLINAWKQIGRRFS